MRKFWIPVLMAGLFTLGTVSVPSAAQAKIKLGKLLKKRLKKKKRALKKKLRRLFKKKKNGTFLVLSDKREKRLLRGGPVDKGAKTKKQKIPGVLKRYRNYLDGKAGEAPPSKINHRPQETPVRDQGYRGTCAAFATVAGMERLYKKAKINLSEQDAWYAIKGPIGSNEGYCEEGAFIFDVADALKKSKIALEKNWKYQSSVSEKNCKKWSKKRPKAAKQAARYRIKSYEKVYRGLGIDADEGAFINNPKHVEAILASGYDVVIDVGIAGTGWSDSPKKEVIDVQLGDDDKPVEPIGVDGTHQYHAVLIVGYNRDKEYFIAKNSWGKSYARRGYIHLSYDYVRAYSRYGVFITDVVGD